MAVTLSTNAAEESTYVITASFTDETGSTVVPGSVTWTLSTDKGTIVNSRNGVTATAATSITVVLQGDDLAILGRESNHRIFTLQATYDSDAGSDLPLKEEVHFSITPLVMISQ